MAVLVGEGGASIGGEMVVLSRKSWVMAMPIEANARDVRNHARNVRSGRKSASLLSLVNSTSEWGSHPKQDDP